LIPSLVELFQYLQTLFLLYSTYKLEFIGLQHRTTPPESLIKLPKIDHLNMDQIQSISTHDARLHSHKQTQLWNINILFHHLLNTIYLAVSTCIFILICQVVTWCNYFPFPIHENTSYWYFIFICCFFWFLQCLIHQILYLSFREAVLFLHVQLIYFLCTFLTISWFACIIV